MNKKTPSFVYHADKMYGYMLEHITHRDDENSPFGHFVKVTYEAVYSAKHTGLSYRQLNNWQEEGIVCAPKDTEELKWKRYNFKQIVFFQLARKLQERGFSLSRIKKLYDEIISQNEGEYTLFEIPLSLVYFGQPVFLIFFRHNVYDFATKSELDDSLKFQTIWEDYIAINLNVLVYEITGKERFLPKLQLTKAEEKILEEVRNPANSEITIKKCNDRLNYIKSKKRHKVGSKAELDEVLASVDFGSCELSKQNGKYDSVTINKTVKL